MALPLITSPHAHRPLDTATVMKLVTLATLPGVAALTWFFGWGTLINIGWAVLVALASEAAVLKLRQRPVGFFLKDYSAVVTAVLLGIALPPFAPWWIVLIGTAFAIMAGKQLYGGMGYNPFNPAMLGYVLLLISFPVQMTTWTAAAGTTEQGLLGFMPTLLYKFSLVAKDTIDGYTAATTLDTFTQDKTHTVAEIWASHSATFGLLGGKGWEWVNAGFLLGGLFLMYKRIFTWHAPVAMLAGLALMAAIFYSGGSNSSGGSPLYHLFTGATMLGAFFIVTDPVTSAVSVRGRLVYGFMIGVLIYIIRTWGNYPDAMAFAVLIMNLAAPSLDHFTQPRTYGHAKKKGAN